jgi:hypothetical protein
VPKPAPQQTLTPDRLQEHLSGFTHQGSTPELPSPSLWYGLIDVSDGRWVFQDLQKAQQYFDLKVFCFARVFESHDAAAKWKEGVSKVNKDPFAIESSDSSLSEDSTNNKPLRPEPGSRKSMKGKKKDGRPANKEAK